MEFFVLLFLLIHWKVHLAQQFLEARVGTQGVQVRSTDVRQIWLMVLVSLLEPVDGKVMIAGGEICPSDGDSPNPRCLSPAARAGRMPI